MRRVAIIPARFGSTRFPGKALADKTGKYLIQHVFERVQSCRSLDEVIVATDDERIADAVRSFGSVVCMTRSDHPCGTDRVAEAAGQLGLHEDDIVLNVQGDEPEINPDDLDRLMDEGLGQVPVQGDSVQIATLASRFSDDGPVQGSGSPLDPNCVKLVMDASGRAMYFSRSPIPYLRKTNGAVDRPSRYFLHLGVYAFRAGVLMRLAHDAGMSTSEGSTLEEAEALEQLRWLERGFGIMVVVADHRTQGIDTRDDYAAFVKRVSGTMAPGASSPSLSSPP